MTRRLIEGWNHFWFRPASPIGPVVVRIVLAIQALWLVLSRPDLPSLTSWPDAFWVSVPRSLQFRYLLFVRSANLEWVLWGLLICALVMTIVGVAGRIAPFVAGLLLYHFAPMENILSGGALLGFRGFTQSVQGLLLLSFAEPARIRSAPSSENRWPVVATQMLFTLTYFFAGISKVSYTGWSWASGDNMRATAMVFSTWPVHTPWAPWLIAHPAVCWVVALSTLALELLFPLVLFSRVAARILVPMALLGHIAIVQTLGIYFLSTPLLLLFVNWDWVERLLVSQARHRDPIVGGDVSTTPSMQ